MVYDELKCIGMHYKLGMLCGSSGRRVSSVAAAATEIVLQGLGEVQPLGKLSSAMVFVR